MNKTIKLVYLEVFYQEDNSHFHDVISDALNQLDFQVINISREKASIETIVAMKSNILVIDLRRSESPDFHIYQQILRFYEVRKLPILVITEEGYDPFTLGFESTEISDYICYPFTPSTFVSRTRDLLSRGKGVNTDT